jgi:hypothetical protein
VAGLLLWLNIHGFPACAGQPEVRDAPGYRVHGYVAWYENGAIELSEKFDRDGVAA